MFARVVSVAFRIQQALVFLCFLCFVLGFLFSLGRYVPSLQPVIETIALFSILFLLPLELLFLLAALVKIFTKITEFSWGLLLVALIHPVIAYFAVCLFYGTAHF